MTHGIRLWYDEAHFVRCASERAEIEQSIRVILLTRLGEREYLPEFGCRIHELLFSLSDPGRIQQAAMFIEAAIMTWEPRVQAVRISPAWASGNDPSAAGEEADGRLELHVECELARLAGGSARVWLTVADGSMSVDADPTDFAGGAE